MIRGIGNSAISKVSLSVPILAFIILQDDRVINWFESSFSPSAQQQEFWVTQPIDRILKAKLYLIYFGAYIFGVASLLYYTFAPAAPRKYQDEADFAEKTLQVTTLRDVVSLIGQIDHAENWIKKQSNPIDTEMALASLEDANLPETDRRRIYLDVLKSFFCMENERRQALVWMVAFMYCVSIVLLSTPSFLTFLKIVVSSLSELRTNGVF